MSEHAFGRRSYDTEVHEQLGEIRATVTLILKHVETQNGSIARLQAWQNAHDVRDAGSAGASAERSRWLGWCGTLGKHLIPAGSASVATAAVLHWLSGQTK